MKRSKQKLAQKSPQLRSISKRKPWRKLLPFAGAFALVGVVAFFVSRPSRPQPPTISTASLDPVSANAFESQLAAVRKTPRSAEAWGKLGELLRSYEFRTEAIQCFQAAERLGPREPRWPYLHALVVAGSDPAKAKALMRRCVTLCGNTPPNPRLKLARMLAESGDWQEARQHLEMLVRSHPNHGPAWLLLAQTAQTEEKLNEASEHARRASEDRRTARAAWNLLGVLHLRLNQTNEAQRAARQAAATPPDAPLEDPFETEVIRSDARDLSHRVQRLLASGRIAEAGPLVQQLVREHPRVAESWLLMGRWQLMNRNASAAEQNLHRHLTLEPASPNGVFQLGMALLALNRFDEASASFRKAIELKADPGPAYYNLGFALARSGKTREAIEPFHESLKHNPERIDSYLLLADLHVQLGEKVDAQALLRQAESINSSDPRLPTLRSRISGL